MSFKSNRWTHFDPESKLSDFRKRFENLKNPNQMFNDSKVGNNWSNGFNIGGIDDIGDIGDSMISRAKNRMSGQTQRGEDIGIPIHVIHEKSNESQNNGSKDDNNFDKNSDSMSSLGSSKSQRSNDTSNSSGSVGSVFHSMRNQNTSDLGSGSGQPRVHHIPITVEPREGSTSSGYTSETTTPNEQPLSRSSSHSSAHSVGTSGRSPGSEKDVSPQQTNTSDASKRRVCQIPIKIESNGTQESIPLKNDIKSKVKTTGLDQSKEVSNKRKSGPFVTRIPVIGETRSNSNPNESITESTEGFVQNNVQKPNALEVINNILSDLKRYETEVNQFKGTANDKQYKYLDEMLTRFMIKLDTIETYGSEDVRKARKSAIIEVNKYIALLEQKVDKNVSKGHTSPEPMDVSSEPIDESNEKEILNKEPMDSTKAEKQNIMNSEENDSKSEDRTQVTDIENNCNQNQSIQNPINGQRKETAV